MARALTCLAHFAAAALLAPAAAAKVIHVEITKLVFEPKAIAANVGDTVEWANHDIVAHTATAKDKSWDVVIPPGATVSRVFDAAGQTSYFCRFHPNMRAEVDVSP